MDKITAQGKKFVDQHGRERIFRGINVVDKKPHRGTKTTFKYPVDDDYLRRCQSLGFNMIRLGALWDVIEPAPGQYNSAFLDELERIIDRCGKYGIYVFFDIHQDVHSEYANLGGSGAPEWAALTDGYKVKNTQFVWAEGYFFRKAVWAAFKNFWDNAPVQGKGLQDWYADMLQELARRFADKPAFFGYDFMNEPFGDKKCAQTFSRLIANLVKVVLFDKRVKICALLRCLLKSPDRIFEILGGDILLEIMKGGEESVRDFDLNRYTPFLNKMTAAVREIDRNHMVFVDHCYYSNAGVPCNAGPIIHNGEREKNQCFTPHAYDFTVDSPAYENANNDIVRAFFEQLRRSQERLDIPVIVGEWGGGGEGTKWYPHISFLLDLFEKFKWSNTYYFYLEDAEELAYRNKEDVGKEDLFDIPLVDTVLNRPFPMAVCGDISAFHYDETARTFQLRYTQDMDFDAPTVIFLPHAPKSVEVSSGVYELAAHGKGFVIRWTTGIGEHFCDVKI